MQKLKISILNQRIIFTIFIWALICAAIIFKYQFDLKDSILLFLSGGGILFILSPFLKPIANSKRNAIAKRQKTIDIHINMAKKANKKPYKFGKNKQHTIWANNNFNALKIYNLKIAPLGIKKPNEAFYFISEACHNLKQ